MGLTVLPFPPAPEDIITKQTGIKSNIIIKAFFGNKSNWISSAAEKTRGYLLNNEDRLFESQSPVSLDHILKILTLSQNLEKNMRKVPNFPDICVLCYWAHQGGHLPQTSTDYIAA